MKFTTKTTPATGRYRSFFSDHTDIKLKGKEVGEISGTKELGIPSVKAPYRLRFMVIKDDINEDGNPNCEWKWITLKKEFNTVDEAKEFVKQEEVCKAVLEKYNLYTEE